MRRETRYNLIFLGVLVALMAPGAVILFRKKLEPTVRPMYLPDAVPEAVAYLSPEPTPPGKRRVEPQRTGEWVGMIARERGVMKVMRGDDGLPVVSDSKTLQVVSAKQVDGPTAKAVGLALGVIEWREGQGEWSLNGRKVRSARGMRVVIPRIVREELGEHGVLVPPKEIVWWDLDFAEVGGHAQRVTLRLLRRTSRGDGDGVDIVLPFTSPADTAD